MIRNEAQTPKRRAAADGRIFDSFPGMPAPKGARLAARLDAERNMAAVADQNNLEPLLATPFDAADRQNVEAVMSAPRPDAVAHGWRG